MTGASSGEAGGRADAGWQARWGRRPRERPTPVPRPPPRLRAAPLRPPLGAGPTSKHVFIFIRHFVPVRRASPASLCPRACPSCQLQVGGGAHRDGGSAGRGGPGPGCALPLHSRFPRGLPPAGRVGLSPGALQTVCGSQLTATSELDAVSTRPTQPPLPATSHGGFSRGSGSGSPSAGGAPAPNSPLRKRHEQQSCFLSMGTEE